MAFSGEFDLGGVRGEVDCNSIELVVKKGKSVLAILGGEVMGKEFGDGCDELFFCREYKLGEPGNFDQSILESRFVDGFGDGRKGAGFPALWKW
jgi:hypothetical protein